MSESTQATGNGNDDDNEAMGASVSLDSVLRKVNGLPLECTTLQLDQVKALFGGAHRWTEGLQERFTAAQQNGPIQQMFRVFKALGAPRVV